jgi:hypothetical protein
MRDQKNLAGLSPGEALLVAEPYELPPLRGKYGVHTIYASVTSIGCVGIPKISCFHAHHEMTTAQTALISRIPDL